MNSPCLKKPTLQHMFICPSYFLSFANTLLLYSTSFIPFNFSPFLYFPLIFSSLPPCCFFLSSRPSFFRPLSLIILTLFFSFFILSHNSIEVYCTHLLTVELNYCTFLKGVFLLRYSLFQEYSPNKFL